MGNAAKLGDIGTEHDGYHKTPIIVGSSTITIDGKPAARQGDPLEPHDKPSASKHGRNISSGSGSVFFDGKPAARTGDSINCGGVVVGSGTVTVG